MLIPIFDYVIYPALRRWNINFSPIKRIYAGFLVAGLAMLYAAILQHFLYLRSPCHDNQPSACLDENNSPRFVDINVWVVSGPYILVAISEIFVSRMSMTFRSAMSNGRCRRRSPLSSTRSRRHPSA